MSTGWKIWLNLALIALPMLFGLLAAPVVLIGIWLGWGSAPWLLAISLLGVLGGQVMWAGSYPEWPMNLWLLGRLRNACRRRGCGRWIETARMVEWVPRQRWTQTRLDTAEDVMLIRVAGHGIEMEGDRFRYHFPPASILDAHVESLRPSGCFHRLHFVTLTVRSERGPREFPLAFRDHRWSELRSSRRRDVTETLCRRVREIATGGDHFFSDPDWIDPPQRRVAKPKRRLRNPYAAPRD